MAMSKMHKEIMDKLNAIEAKLDGKTAEEAPKVTKEQLMDISGVGSSTADKILKLLK